MAQSSAHNRHEAPCILDHGFRGLCEAHHHGPHSASLTVADRIIDQQVNSMTHVANSTIGGLSHFSTPITISDVLMDEIFPIGYQNKTPGTYNNQDLSLHKIHSLSTAQTMFHTVIKPPLPSTFDLFPLIADILKPKSQELYLRAYTQFFNKWSRPLTTVRQLDEALATYICEAYFDDPAPSHRQEMSYMLAYIALSHPEYKKKLGLARRTLKGWKKKVPPRSSFPLTKQLMLAFFQFLFAQGDKAAAVAIAVQWGSYLRGSEVLSLTAGDIAFPGDPRLAFTDPSLAGIQIKEAKTGTMQFTPLRDKDVLALLRGYYQTVRDPSHLLFPIAYKTYLSMYKKASLWFKLDGFTTHSARIGGALHEFSMGISAETIAVTGRWASLSSLKHYLQNGRAWLLQMPLTEIARQKIEDAANRCTSLIAYSQTDLPSYMECMRSAGCRRRVLQ